MPRRPWDGVLPLQLPTGPDPMPPLDEKELTDAQTATVVPVRQGPAAIRAGCLLAQVDQRDQCSPGKVELVSAATAAAPQPDVVPQIGELRDALINAGDLTADRIGRQPAV